MIIPERTLENKSEALPDYQPIDHKVRVRTCANIIVGDYRIKAQSDAEARARAILEARHDNPKANRAFIIESEKKRYIERPKPLDMPKENLPRISKDNFLPYEGEKTLTFGSIVPIIKLRAMDKERMAAARSAEGKRNVNEDVFNHWAKTASAVNDLFIRNPRLTSPQLEEILEQSRLSIATSVHKIYGCNLCSLRYIRIADLVMPMIADDESLNNISEKTKISRTIIQGAVAAVYGMSATEIKRVLLS